MTTKVLNKNYICPQKQNLLLTTKNKNNKKRGNDKMNRQHCASRFWLSFPTPKHLFSVPIFCNLEYRYLIFLNLHFSLQECNVLNRLFIKWKNFNSKFHILM